MSSPDEYSSSPSDTETYFGITKKTTFLVGIAGGTCSGKNEVCNAIVQKVNEDEKLAQPNKIILISQDSFYRDLTPDEHEKAANGLFNFDHPGAIDFDLMLSSLVDIKDGISTKIPVYDLKKNARVQDQIKVIGPSDVVMLEGILVFYRKDIRELFDMKLYVDSDADTRLSKRLQHDMAIGRTLENVLLQYTQLVKPAYEEFCAPTKKYADVIIPRGAENEIATNVISHRIVDILVDGKTYGIE